MVREVHLCSSSPLYLLQIEAPWKGFSEPALQDPSSNSFPSMPSYRCISKSRILTVCPSVPCSSLRHLCLRTTFSLAFPALSESPALAGLCSSAYTPTPQGRGTPTLTHRFDSVMPLDVTDASTGLCSASVMLHLNHLTFQTRTMG